MLDSLSRFLIGFVSSIAIVGTLIVVGAHVVGAQTRHQYPADAVYFTDATDLQEKYDAGALGGLAVCSEVGLDLVCDDAVEATTFRASRVPGAGGAVTFYQDPDEDLISGTPDGGVVLGALAGGRYVGFVPCGIAFDGSVDPACPYMDGGSGLDWAFTRLGGSNVIAFTENDPSPVDLVSFSQTTTSAAGLVDYEALAFCTGGGNAGAPCPVGNECGAGTCDEWGGFRVNKVGTFFVRAEIGYRIDDTSGRYPICPAGANAGQTCRIDADCPSSTCSGTTGAASTLECAQLELRSYPSGSVATGTHSPAVIAPIGQTYEGSAVGYSRAQFPRQSGTHLTTCSSAPCDYYFDPNKCNTSQATQLDFTLIGSATTFAWLELSQ